MEINHLDFPLVSVIIPAYNAAQYISNTLNSVLEQTYKHMEIVVIDDGSTDQTLQILQKIQTHHAISVYTQNNKGAAAARNAGFRISKGELIKFLDGDDLIDKEMIAQQVELALIHAGSIVSSSWGRFYNNDTSTFKLVPNDFPQKLSSLDWICQSWGNAQSMTNPGLFLIPREVITQAGLWNEELSLLDDTEYFTRTLLAADQIVCSQASVLYYRSGNPQSLSAMFGKQHAQSAFQAVTQSVNYILTKESNQHIRLLCANTLQSLVYSLYPAYQELCKLLEVKIADLGGSTLFWPASPTMQSAARLIGWRWAKKLQLMKHKLSNG